MPELIEISDRDLGTELPTFPSDSVTGIIGFHVRDRAIICSSSTGSLMECHELNIAHLPAPQWMRSNFTMIHQRSHAASVLLFNSKTGKHIY